MALSRDILSLPTSLRSSIGSPTTFSTSMSSSTLTFPSAAYSSSSSLSSNLFPSQARSASTSSSTSAPSSTPSTQAPEDTRVTAISWIITIAIFSTVVLSSIWVCHCCSSKSRKRERSFACAAEREPDLTIEEWNQRGGMNALTIGSPQNPRVIKPPTVPPEERAETDSAEIIEQLEMHYSPRIRPRRQRSLPPRNIRTSRNSLELFFPAREEADLSDRASVAESFHGAPVPPIRRLLSARTRTVRPLELEEPPEVPEMVPPPEYVDDRPEVSEYSNDLPEPPPAYTPRAEDFTFLEDEFPVVNG